MPLMPNRLAELHRVVVDRLLQKVIERTPIHIEVRQLALACDLGFTFYVGPELEYFYFRAADDPLP